MDTKTFETPIGSMVAAVDDDALVGLWFVGQKHFPDICYQNQSDAPIFNAVGEWLEGYFSGKNEKFPLDIKPRGSEFALKVWEQIAKIPYGETTTYGAIANALGKTTSARAVGGAVGKNPISLIIPCHRVMGANNALTGYAGGIDRKKHLLQLENIIK